MIVQTLLKRFTSYFTFFSLLNQTNPSSAKAKQPNRMLPKLFSPHAISNYTIWKMVQLQQPPSPVTKHSNTTRICSMCDAWKRQPAPCTKTKWSVVFAICIRVKRLVPLVWKLPCVQMTVSSPPIDATAGPIWWVFPYKVCLANWPAVQRAAHAVKVDLCTCTGKHRCLLSFISLTPIQ